MEEKAIVISNGILGQASAKTTNGLIRYSGRFEIMAVIDHNHAGQDAGEVIDGIHRNIPIFATIDAFNRATREKPDVCIIGIATRGGRVPEDMRPTLIDALKSGMSLVNGLHEFLGDDRQLAAVAAENGAKIIDIRKPRPKDQLHFWTGKVRSVTTPRIAVLGTDCNLGKRTTTRYLTQACEEAGIQAEMIYTGQTGWLQGGRYGFIFDSTYNDFIPGELEHAVVTCFEETRPDVMFLEGQSDLLNPSGPCGSEFLLSTGARGVILQHAPHRVYYHGCESLEIPIPPLDKFMQLIQLYGGEVLALTLNTKDLSFAEAKRYQEEYQQTWNIPVVLPAEEGVVSLVPVIKNYLSAQKQSYAH